MQQAPRLTYFFQQKGQINKEELLLVTGVQTPYNQLQEILTLKEPYDRLWKSAVTFNKLFDKWMNGPILEVDAEEVEAEVSKRLLTLNSKKIFFDRLKTFGRQLTD